ncbi:hypothetical protein V8G57_08935 [Collimonas sp. H4R21]|uniref:Uncharacterized protein n=1 Tax=Collimonas rhizosphaerae TaxID=3126357 RepID=A0ABU9PU10_9BURK
MIYTNVVTSYDNPVSLTGRLVRAFVAEYSFVALLLDTDEVVNFATDEVVVGKWFEVFPIRLYELPPDYKVAWNEFDEPIEVIGSMQVWREEWRESVVNDGQFMGAGPNFVQFSAALGGSPKTVESVVKVHAGVKLLGHDGRCLVVCSSHNTPFKIDLATDEQDVEQIMKNHTCQ